MAFFSRPHPATLDDEALEKRYKASKRTAFTALGVMTAGTLALGLAAASLFFPAIAASLPALTGAAMIWGGMQIYSTTIKDTRTCSVEKLSRLLRAEIAAGREARADMPQPAAPEFNTKAAITLDSTMRVSHALKIKPPGGFFPA